MCARRRWLAVVMAVALTSVGGTALAQMSMFNPSPATDVSGYASSEMSRIYRQSIGNNYSADRMIQRDLNRAQSRVPFVGQSLRPSAGFDLGLPSRRASKPFSNISSPPTVSPWMNMFRNDLSGEGDLNYQTLVRPRLDQERVNRQLEQQNIELGQRMQAASARNAYNPQGSQQMYPTGHPTVFRNVGHYYPSHQGR